MGLKGQNYVNSGENGQKGLFLAQIDVKSLNLGMICIKICFQRITNFVLNLYLIIFIVKSRLIGIKSNVCIFWGKWPKSGNFGP